MEQVISSINIQQCLKEIKCANFIRAKRFCCSQNCNQSCFMCSNDNCKCNTQAHIKCFQMLKVQQVLHRLIEKRGKISKQLEKSLELVMKIYDEAIEKLSIGKQEVLLWRDMYGLSKDQAKFLNLIIEGRVTEITGHMGSCIKKTIHFDPQYSAISQKLVKQFWEKRSNHFDNLLSEMKQIYRAKALKLQSHIVTQTDMLEMFLSKPVLSFKLIYRASQQKYSVSEFHAKCDGVRHTLLLAKTQFDKIIGGYTPLPWKSQIGYATDDINQTFIFSLTLGEKYPLLDKSKAIYCRDGYGPDFGQDICIRPGSNENKDSYCKFPSHFNNGNYTKTQQSIAAFCGATVDQFVRIVQWEVFQIQWLID